MSCLKCGKDTQDRNVFCPDCLQVMRAYPVKPGTAIHILRREPLSAEKRQPSRRRVIPAEEQLPLLHRTIRRLYAVIFVLFLLLCTAITLLVHSLFPIT